MKKIIVFLTLLLLIPQIVLADGGMMPPLDNWIYETGQKAIILHENNIETLVLQTSYQGDAKNFAYIVPTPNIPEVTKISNDIFTNLSILTQPKYYATPLSYGAAEITTKDLNTGVEVLEEKQVGIYDIKVLSANNANALFDWLKENDFTYPADKKYILDDYISNNWFFTTAKINQESISDEIQNKLYTGDLTPLKFVFESPNIVYPLKISSVTEENTNNIYYSENQVSSSTDLNPIEPAIAPYPYENAMPITIYIFSDHKKEISGFSIEYASWVSKNDIQKLGKDSVGNPWVNISKKMYLTKLYSYMNVSDMTDDLFPDNAKDNTTVGVPTLAEKTIDWFSKNSGWVMLIILFMFFIPMIWQFRKTSKGLRIILWMSQIVSFIIYIIPFLIIIGLLIPSGEIYRITYNSPELIVFWYLLTLILSMISLMIIEKSYQKKL